jgi:hypothetical protein
MEFRTSLEAVAMTSSLGFGFGREAFSLSRRKTFSTSTMASSTTMPMATARPPRVIEFTLMPNHLKTSRVTAKERASPSG